MPFTTNAAQSILSQQFSPNNYLGLSTSTPDSSGGNFSEPGASTGYVRTNIGELDTSKPGQIANKGIIFFFEALSDCGTFTHFGVFTNANSPTPIFYGELANAGGLPVTAGYVPLIRAHEFIVGLDVDVLDTSY